MGDWEKTDAMDILNKPETPSVKDMMTSPGWGYTPVRAVIVRAGDAQDGIVFTEQWLEAMAGNNRNQLLHYDKETKELYWLGLVYGEKN